MLAFQSENFMAILSSRATSDKSVCVLTKFKDTLGRVLIYIVNLVKPMIVSNPDLKRHASI